MLEQKNFNESSVFTPENLLREARRQKNIPEGNIPEVCVLDPDRDIVKLKLILKKGLKTEALIH